jgi:hypothetical protein
MGEILELGLLKEAPLVHLWELAHMFQRHFDKISVLKSCCQLENSSLPFNCVDEGRCDPRRCFDFFFLLKFSLFVLCMCLFLVIFRLLRRT